MLVSATTSKDPSYLNQTCSSIWNGSVRILNKHTDLISSLGILAITTCLLAAKILKNFPPLLPHLALVVYNFSGIIWLNVQWRDLSKSVQDLQRGLRNIEIKAFVQVAVKVMVKTFNVFLTCALFSASVLAASGFPHCMTAIYAAIRPFSLSSLVLGIFSDLHDYFKNEDLLKQLNSIEVLNSLEVSKVMICFLEIIKNLKPSNLALSWPFENRYADQLVRQLDEPTIATFQEALHERCIENNLRTEALKLFYHVKDSLQSKQAGTKANLSLIVLGYLAIGVSRAFPDTLADMASRWSMSVLYTDEMIRQKLFQADLETNLKLQIDKELSEAKLQ